MKEYCKIFMGCVYVSSKNFIGIVPPAEGVWSAIIGIISEEEVELELSKTGGKE